MNKFPIRLLSFVFVAMFSLGSLQAQIVINEISYNPPESGNDSLEYIELLNTGITAVNIHGWYFQLGINDTLPNIELQPGEYFVTAINAQAMMSVFGITVQEWLGGALSNSGEHISLVDSDGVEVDRVEFEDGDPWPSDPDGNGPSLELIDSGLDNNDGANWQACGTGTGVIIEGNEVFGTPGALNSDGGSETPDVTIAVGNFRFNPKDIVVATGSLVRWINNEVVAHNVNGNQGTFPNNPASFGNGAPAPNWEYDFTPIVVGLYNYHCDPHAGSGMKGTMSVYDPNSYTDFPLPHLRITDGVNGAHLFDGVPTRITGVVHGVNFRPDGYSFFIIDDNNVGMNVFSFDPLSYVVAEGDMITVSGTMDAFNGMLEIVPDSIEVLSTGNSLNSPRTISTVREMDESSYLFSNLEVDSVGNISTAGYTIYTSHQSGSTIEVRVDVDAGIPSEPSDFVAGTSIDVTGIGTQFDNNFPWNEGYQLLALEIGILNSVPVLNTSEISMSPNPSSDFIRLASDLHMTQIEIFAANGQQLYLEKVSNNHVQINIHSLPVGLHLVKATTEEGIWTSMISVMR